jgi:hypothetical protein
MALYMVEETECFICGAHRPNSIESHHVVPRRYGGSDAPENLVNLCSSCHSAIEKIYDDSFYDRLEVEETEVSKNRSLDVVGTTIPAMATTDRSFPMHPVHINRERFGLEISFTQFMLHQTEELIPEQLPEADLLLQKLEDVDIETLRQRAREWDSLGNQAKEIMSAYPEDERLTPPIRIVKSQPNLDDTPTNKQPITTNWFSRLHCGYCHTVYSESEKADLAAHLRVQHHIENPYENESEDGENLRPSQL